MQSNVRSRAGLVVLAFALIIPLVSAVPIPSVQTLRSELSPALSSHGQDLIHCTNRPVAQIPLPKGPVCDPMVVSGALSGNVCYIFHPITTPRHRLIFMPQKTPFDGENQLVRRNARLNARIRAAFRVCLLNPKLP